MNYHHGDLHNALVMAGIELLAEKGVEALTLREVARRAKVSHAAPYRHFADKTALLAAIAHEGFDKLNKLLGAVADGEFATEMERLESAMLGYVDFGKAHPHHIELMFGELARAKPHHLEVAALQAFNNLVTLTASAMLESNPTDSRNPRLVAIGLWGQTHGFAILSAHVDFDALVGASAIAQSVQHAIAMSVSGLMGNRQGASTGSD